MSARTLQPFYVTLTYGVVVMATNEADAVLRAESLAYDIVSDCDEPSESDAVKLTSRAQLAKLDGAWAQDCHVYGGDSPKLSEVLPEEDPPAPDTLTLPMFPEVEVGHAG